MTDSIGTTGLVMNEPLIFEKSSEGKSGIEVPKSDVGDMRPKDVIPADLLRTDIEGFPEVSEVDVGQEEEGQVFKFSTLSFIYNPAYTCIVQTKIT